MIIGAILETSDTEAGQGSSGENGTALVTFYTWQDAINWAIYQSQRITYGSTNADMYTLCTVLNTDTGDKRWWYNGVEYTG